MFFAPVNFLNYEYYYMYYLGMLVLWFISLGGAIVGFCLGRTMHKIWGVHMLFHSCAAGGAVTYGLFRIINIAMCGFNYTNFSDAS